MMNTNLLRHLHRLDLLDEVPEEEPEDGTVLSRRCCPLHDDADNPLAFLVYKDGYACMTRRCHKTREFGPNLYGLIRHLVYRATGEVKPFKDAIRFAERHPDRLRRLIPEGARYKGRDGARWPSARYSGDDLAACLRVPDEYYLGRGYRPETLRAFGVGTCVRRLPDGKDLLGWSVLPVFDGGHSRERSLVGYTARNPRWSAGDRYPRWLTGFEKSRVLFNFGNALRDRGPLILCEGPGDAMRLWEAGYTRAVATFGSSISDDQIGRAWMLLQPGEKFYVAADADEAGKEFARQVRVKVGNDPEVIFPLGEAKDFGEMTVEQIRSMGLAGPRSIPVFKRRGAPA